MKELRETIDNFEKTIRKIIGILNEVIQEIEKYYNINNYNFNNFEKNRTYEYLCNIINLMNTNKNDYTIQDMNEIINDIDIDIYNLFNNIFIIIKMIYIINNFYSYLNLIKMKILLEYLAQNL